MLELSIPSIRTGSSSSWRLREMSVQQRVSSLNARRSSIGSLFEYCKQDAEDAVQDGLLKAYVNLEGFQGRSSFGTWLTRVVINSALMIRRKRHAHLEASLDEVLEARCSRLRNATVDRQPNPEEAYAKNEIDVLVGAQAQRLSPHLRLAFRIHLENGSKGSSCDENAIPASTLKSRVLRARRKVLSGLQDTLAKDLRDLASRRPSLAA